LIESLGAMTEVEGKENVTIGGDFNMRLGNLGKKRAEEEEMDSYSRDSCISNRGKRFMEWLNEKSWKILNGCTERLGWRVYIYRCSVIDYVMVRVGSDSSHRRLANLK